MKKKQKLLFITHVGDLGGAEHKMVELCLGSGGESHVLHLQEGEISKALSDQGIPSSCIPMPAALVGFKRKEGFLKSLRLIPQMFTLIGKIAKTCAGYDAVFCMSQKSFFLAAAGKILFKKPVIWFMNDLLTPEHFSKSLIRLSTLMARLFADWVVVNSQASLDAWIAAKGDPGKVSVIYSGINHEAGDQKLKDKRQIEDYKTMFAPDGRPLVGMFGRISHWKGQDLFLRALALVPDVNGVVVGGALFGEEPYLEELKTLATQLGLDDRLTFYGNADDVMPLMAACDVVVHCSRAAEPFGRVIVEAMLAGTSVVASNAGGVREIVIDGKTGMLAAPGSPEDIARKISSILQKPGLARSMRTEARSRAENKFTSRAMVRDFNGLLKKCA